jgi:thiol-disulfide isomerase/thioredoxin
MVAVSPTLLSLPAIPGGFEMRLLALLALTLFPAAVDAQEIPAGGRVPEIDLPTLPGGRVKLSTLRGRPVVVTFWGTWCPPCRAEFPELVAAYRKYREMGLEILAVNQRDQELSTRDVQAFVKEYSVEFTVALDARGKARRSFRLIALPTTVFVDAAGMIQLVHSGPINRAELARGLAAILPPKERLP